MVTARTRRRRRWRVVMVVATVRVTGGTLRRIRRGKDNDVEGDQYEDFFSSLLFFLQVLQRFSHHIAAPLTPVIRMAC